jgi:predicted Rossmann-fold nucleotide-binding protein
MDVPRPTALQVVGARVAVASPVQAKPPAALSVAPDAQGSSGLFSGPAHPHPLHIGEVPALDERYVAPASRACTVVICAGSSSKPGVVAYEPFTAALARSVVGVGGNVLTGGGTKGPMGAAFNAAALTAKEDKAGQNLMVMKEPVWGDEDFVKGRGVGRAPTEEARFDLFQRLGATLVICPGGPGALLEASKAIMGVAYPNPDLPQFDTIVVVGDFYEGLKRQVETYVAAGTMKPEQAAKLRFVPPTDELIAEITSKIRQAVAARDT